MIPALIFILIIFSFGLCVGMLIQSYRLRNEMHKVYQEMKAIMNYAASMVSEAQRKQS